MTLPNLIGNLKYLGTCVPTLFFALQGSGWDKHRGAKNLMRKPVHE